MFRIKKGKNFIYVDKNKKPIKDKKQLERIKGLRVLHRELAAVPLLLSEHAEDSAVLPAADEVREASDQVAQIGDADNNAPELVEARADGDEPRAHML